MRENKCIHFKPKKSGLLKDKDAPSLLLDMEHQFFEYTFTKKKPKTKDEIYLDIQSKRNPLIPHATRVTVTMKLKDIVMVDYDEALGSVMIVGSFCVTYKNIDQEIVRNYSEKHHAFSLEDEFENMKAFVDTIDSFEKTERCTSSLVLVNL